MPVFVLKTPDVVQDAKVRLRLGRVEEAVSLLCEEKQTDYLNQMVQEASDPSLASLVVSSLFGRGETRAALEMSLEHMLTPGTEISAALPMLWIPRGEFMMGAPEGEGFDSEKPQHKVTIRNSFFMDKFVLRNSDFGSKFEEGRGNYPCLLSFSDAEKFLTELTEREIAAGRIPEDWCYCLPSEAQWEYACRAGTTGPRPGGLDQIHCIETGATGIAEVGTKNPNPWGLYDMLGNVWEWVDDDYHPNYIGAPEDETPWIDWVEVEDGE